MLNNSNLYGSEWLALVFSNRNQNYGAYVLRSQSSHILLRALFIVAPLFTMLFVGPMIYAQLHKDSSEPINKTVVVDIDPIYKMEKQQEKQEVKKEDPIKSAPPAQQQVVKSTLFTNNIELVENTDAVPPTATELQNSVIASTAQIGASGPDNAIPTGNSTGSNAGTGEQVGTNEIMDISGVDQFPEFPGGMDAWSKFIQKNLRYPYAAQDSNIQGKVYLSFVVEKDGSISDVKVIKGIGYGCDDEAIRVIKKSPRWKAGMQNKQFVRVRYNMPINYMLSQ